MTISIPSREIYAVDVPEISSFEGKFVYNFFTPDESVSETGGIPVKFLTKKADQVDATFIQYAVTRTPRYVKFNFSLPHLYQHTNTKTELKQRNKTFNSTQSSTLIADNIDKIVNEDYFASMNFIAVNFHDSEIDTKVHAFVSGTNALRMLGEQGDNNLSQYKIANKLSANTPSTIKTQFLTNAMTNQTQNGTTFFDSNGKLITNSHNEKLYAVSVNAQINGRLFHDITNRMIRDPHAIYAADMQNTHTFTKKLKNTLTQQSQLNESDYKAVVPYVDMQVQRTNHQTDHTGGEIVGYIIDKSEVTINNGLRACQPIIIENANSVVTADFKVKYNTTYVYSIRTIALFKIPAIDNETGDVAILKVLISSKPSNKVYVNTIETIAPPTPSDLNFTWNYERINPLTMENDSAGKPYPGSGVAGSLMIHWTFPPNSQRDIKKFQVFRRQSINHPFELIKMFDFDDSLVRSPDNESPDPNLIEYIKSPCNFIYDDDFMLHSLTNRTLDEHVNDDRIAGSSTYIYAVAAVDAHGYTSNYSAQFEVYFDQFKNQLQKRLISHSGAPKPYPNLYLEADSFLDTIQVSGAASKKMRLVFNPEFYYLSDTQNNVTQVLSTNQTGGNYQLQFLNLDNQKSGIVTVSIDDQLNGNKNNLSNAEIRL